MGGARNQERRLETLANDLANAQTPGFKSQETIYRQIHNDATALGNPNQAMGLHHPVRFLPEDRLPVVMDERYTKFSQGALKMTGNDLDVALTGEGFFTLQGPNGPTYTRNGSFNLSRDGVVVNSAGQAVLTDGGTPLQLPTAQGKLTVANDGYVFVGDEQVGRLGIVKFPKMQELIRMGDSNYRHPDAKVVPEQVAEAEVRQGYLELSNVSPVHTMAMLIKTNRVFELNTRAMQAYKAMDDQAARDVGRT
jgi:flagellar basal-body rod protein FlgG